MFNSSVGGRKLFEKTKKIENFENPKKNNNNNNLFVFRFLL